MGSVFWHVLFCISGKFESFKKIIIIVIVVVRYFRIQGIALLLYVEENSKSNLQCLNPLSVSSIGGVFLKYSLDHTPSLILSHQQSQSINSMAFSAL